MYVNSLQPEKAYEPILDTEFGIVICSKFVLANALSEITVIPSDKVTLFKLLVSNADTPIVVTLSGIEIYFILLP